jgi:hypothetical protein
MGQLSGYTGRKVPSVGMLIEPRRLWKRLPNTTQASWGCFYCNYRGYIARGQVEESSIVGAKALPTKDALTAFVGHPHNLQAFDNWGSKAKVQLS